MVVTVVLGRLKLPTVAGLLVSGAILGPHGLGFVDAEEIKVIAEVGVVLLLFTIGLELSLERLRPILKQVATGGLIQVGLTFLVTFGIAIFVGKAPKQAVFFGFVFALSSTAVVLRLLSERRELDAPHGRFIVGALVFQDLCVVPMMLIVPLLGGDAAAEEGGLALEVGLALTRAVAVVAGVWIMAKLVVPRALAYVDASRSREVFLLAVLALCAGTAWLTSLAGLSLALGAFLGGVVVAGTDFRHRAMGDVLPLKDVFVSFFFVSLGMFFDFAVIVESPLEVLLLLLGFTLGKGVLATLAALVMRFPPRAAWLAGVGLAQFGEFGFLLGTLAVTDGVVGGQEIAPLLQAGIISMFLTPILVRRARHITAGERVLAPLSRLLRARGIEEVEKEKVTLHDHVLVIGFGVAGGMVCRALRRMLIPHVALELNAETVRRARKRGVAVYYGDATSEEALHHAHVTEARAVVILINDPHAALRILDTIRRVAPDVPVLARARYLFERQAVLDAGADDVITEELEGGMEMLARVLRELGFPGNLVNDEIATARATTFGSARAETSAPQPLAKHQALAKMEVENVALDPESPAVGLSPRELDLRQATGALLVAIHRDEELNPSPSPDQKLAAGDMVYLVGPRRCLDHAVELLAGPATAAVPSKRLGTRS